MKLSPTIPNKLENVIDVIMSSKIQCSWRVFVNFKEISGSTVMNYGSLIGTIFPKAHKIIGAPYILSDIFFK